MISVVMPAHNEEAYLQPAVEAVVAGLTERGVAFEVLVCENGSTDHTREVAHDLVATWPTVRLLELGVADYGQALRAGFLAARGELVVTFDVDFVDLTFLDQAVKVAEQDELVIVVGSKRSPARPTNAKPAGSW